MSTTLNCEATEYFAKPGEEERMPFGSIAFGSCERRDRSTTIIK